MGVVILILNSIIAKISESDNNLEEIVNLTKTLSDTETRAVLVKAGLSEETINSTQMIMA